MSYISVRRHHHEHKQVILKCGLSRDPHASSHLTFEDLEEDGDCNSIVCK